eukprot:scaffold61260_cov63-Attheya_sp.AAC.2
MIGGIYIPDVIQSQLLSSFCSGTTISTYFHVLSCNHSLQPGAFPLIRDALVDRYKNLAQSKCLACHEEVRDVLDVIREDIRTCHIVTSADGRIVCDEGEASLREALVTKISGWCAIVDYFDKMMPSDSHAGEFVMWCGALETHGFGTIQKACLSTPYWTVTALDYFYEQLELNHHYLVHPAVGGLLPLSVLETPFGLLEAESHSDGTVLRRMRHSLSIDHESARFIFVPSQQEYEPTLGFALNDGGRTQGKSLTCYWDGADEGDFEYSLSRFPENAIRILTRINQCND